MCIINYMGKWNKIRWFQQWQDYTDWSLDQKYQEKSPRSSARDDPSHFFIRVFPARFTSVPLLRTPSGLHLQLPRASRKAPVRLYNAHLPTLTSITNNSYLLAKRKNLSFIIEKSTKSKLFSNKLKLLFRLSVSRNSCYSSVTKQLCFWTQHTDKSNGGRGRERGTKTHPLQLRKRETEAPVRVRAAWGIKIQAPNPSSSHFAWTPKREVHKLVT